MEAELRALVSPLLFGSFSLLALVFYLLKAPSHPLPPSPPSFFPIVGHARLVSLPHPCKVFAELGKSLGDIIHVSVYGRPTIFLNSVEDVRELLDKRGAIYSSRPRSVLMGEMHGWGNTITNQPYGDRFRAMSRMYAQGFNSQASKDYHDFQSKQAGLSLKKMLEEPDKFEELVLAYSSATILKATFGYDLGSENDKFTGPAMKAAESIFDIGMPGTRAVDYIPALRFLPSWLPGMGWKRKAIRDRHLADDMLNVPYDDMQRRRSIGEALPSLVNRLIDGMEANHIESEEHVTNIKNTAAEAYFGAVGTTRAVLMSFALMMVLHPDDMMRAQEEIDSVVGALRLPDLQDRPSLPYIDCIIKEVFRLCPPAEINTSHVLVQEDVYKGMRIPAGSVVHANIWKMCRDPNYFKDPEEFKPERFWEKVKKAENSERVLNSFDPEDPATLVFGFGRRICPGRFFANSNVWLLISGILAVFDITAKRDPLTGKDIRPRAEFAPGFTNPPMPFDFEIHPRNERCAKLIRDLAA